jgi:hypothetical protein
MKTIAAILLALTSAAFSAVTTFEMGYYNKYLGFGSGGVLHNDRVVQSSINVQFDNGLYLNLWGSVSPDGKSNLGDELDYKVGWTGEIGKGWKGNFFLAYFDEPRIGTLGAGDILHAVAGISHSIGEYEFDFTVKNYTPTGGSNFEGGWLIGPSVSRNFALTENLSVFAKVSLWHDDGGFGQDDGFVLNPYVSVDWKITEHFTWSLLNANGYVLLDVHDSREDDVMLGTGFKIEF